MYDHCKALGKPISGNAAGHADITDFSGWRLGPFPQILGWRPKGIGAMAGCVLTAVLGMAFVVWYALGGGMTDEEVEREVREHLKQKDEKRRKMWGFVSGKGLVKGNATTGEEEGGALVGGDKKRS
jgi:iron transport multicopper oxidase